MFFNDWIAFFSDAYLFLGMCATLNFKYFHFDSYGNGINSTLAITFASIIVVLPLFVGLFYKNFLKLTSA